VLRGEVPSAIALGPRLGVIVNAAIDALADLGVTHIDMQVTAERGWRAIRAAQPVESI
jgi:hypothetical protein